MALSAFRNLSIKATRSSLAFCSKISDAPFVVTTSSSSSANQRWPSNSTLLHIPARCLYSEEHLGLPGFRRQRAAASERFGSSMKEQYIERLRASLSKQPSDPVFSDDIKTVISLAESKDDVGLMIELLRRYLKQNNELVPDFRFGPLVMRVLLLTGQCDLALALYRDADLKPMFAQFTSTWLLLDMLYEDARCIEALSIYEDFCKLTSDKTIPPACTTLALACCYKMNSQESFARCLEILKEAQARGSTVGSRGVCFAAMLALKLHKPAVCLEILALRPRSLRPTPLNNLRAMALAELGRVEDAIHILRIAAHQDEPTGASQSRPLGRTRRATIFPDTLDRVNSAAFKLNDKNVMQRMRSIENALRDGGHVIAGQRFDDFLAMSIRLPRRATGSSLSSSSSSRTYRSSSSSSSYRQPSASDDEDEVVDIGESSNSAGNDQDQHEHKATNRPSKR